MVARIRIWAAVALAASLVPTMAGAGAVAPRLSGTYIQLWRVHRTWSAEDWNRLFGYFSRLHLSQLVIQWSSYDDNPFYTTAGGQAGMSPGVVAELLDRADSAGIKVWVGLSYSSSYWQAVKNDPVLVRVLLQRMRLQATKTAESLVPLTARHRSFAGWYVPEEVDDVNWNGIERRPLLIEHLRELRSDLSRLTPGTKVAISGFSSAHLSSGALVSFWGEIIASAPFDRVFFQDGIGAHKIALAALAGTLGALRTALKQTGCSLCVTVETFEQESGENSESRFRAVPAPFDRLISQMTIAARYSQCDLMAFGIPEYMSPFGGEAARSLFEKYCEHYGF